MKTVLRYGTVERMFFMVAMPLINKTSSSPAKMAYS